MDAGYDDDLAFVHEAGFTQLTEAAARMVLEEAPPRPGDLAVDLGCGGGTLLRLLVDAGYQGYGVDLSPAMVDLARKQVPEAEVRVGDALREPLPEAAVVTAVGEVFNYAFVERSDDDVEAALARVFEALRPGGLLLFDVATTGRAGDGPTHAQRVGKGWRVEATAEEEAGWLTRTIETWRRVDGAERYGREVHRLRLLQPEWVLGVLRRVGFEAERLGGYDDFGFQDGWDGFLARKPS